IDTVGLAGEGFRVHVAEGARVRAGEALLSFDLDLLARRARSLLTPVIVSAERGFRVLRRSQDRAVAVGDFLMEIGPATAPAVTATAPAAAPALTRRVSVKLAHGIHARPAALLAASVRNVAAEVRMSAHGRHANARSTVALMALGVQHGDEIELGASGPDAGAALEAMAAVLSVPAQASAPAAAARAAPAAAAATLPADGMLAGVTASPGLGVGEAVQLRRPEPQVREAGADPATENARLARARAAVRSQLERAAQGPNAAASDAAREIAAAHLALLDDPELVSGAGALLGAGKSAGFAWRSTLRAAAQALRQLPDPRLRERADDLLDLESQVLVELQGEAGGSAALLKAHSIVIARELLPSQLLALDGARIAGIGLAGGGATSHVSIIAAAMGIPTLVALGPAVLAIADGTPLVLDAARGVLETRPGPERLARARGELTALSARRAGELIAAQRESRTADGIRIEVFANVGSVAEAEAAVKNGAEGCGLLRTEFLFLDRQAAPSEGEQTAAYEAIATALGARPLTIRTLDAGGDKPIAYLPLPPEENPALGLRGVRTGLAFPQLLRTQLRAVLALRARTRCRLLLPMITDVEDLAAVRALLQEARRELGFAAELEVGVMIETPAAALLADSLARAADFLSLGTNDLTQYTLAMDRGHPQLAARLDALHPAVLRLIARTAQAARAHGRHTAVCGGLASEPLAAPLLIGLGVNELSAVPAVIPQLKARIGQVTMAQCRELAQQALEAETAAAVRELLARALPPAGALP
ncbi:MAG TPA: phosphoenolpyruvate--protein phosphotransferase, partial [Steroidobacteraceae bacterium]|nr:phosphoenolpyruvate--protein phosphotransferase [Steroidobacteraceae bacterium]